MRGWVRGAVILGSVVIVAGGLAAYPAVRDDEKPATAGPQPRSASALVTRGDLVVTEEVAGTLGYAGSHSILSGMSGTVTSLAAVGSVVGRGQELFAVNGVAVRLLFGSTPSYRTLTVGAKGIDVQQLELNLIALGYGAGWTADKRYTSYTAARVRRWQKDGGHEMTGEVQPGDIVFAPGPVRIAKRGVAVGATVAPGQPILDGTSDRPVISIDLPVDQRQLARKGMRVEVKMPDGRTIRGKVKSIGRVAQEAKGGSDDTPTVTVKVDLEKPEDVGTLDAAPVKVRFESQRRKKVLSVPVNALIALPAGGYAVTRSDNHRNVTVELGVFANGRVEISGEGLREGMRVEVPAP